MVDYEVPTKFDTARLVLEEKTFEEYPGMMHRTMTIFLAPHDHMDVYLSNHKYTVQQEATKVIGVDTARYLFEVDGRYAADASRAMNRQIKETNRKRGCGSSSFIYFERAGG